MKLLGAPGWYATSSIANLFDASMCWLFSLFYSLLLERSDSYYLSENSDENIEYSVYLLLLSILLCVWRKEEAEDRRISEGSNSLFLCCCCWAGSWISISSFLPPSTSTPSSYVWMQRFAVLHCNFDEILCYQRAICSLFWFYFFNLFTSLSLLPPSLPAVNLFTFLY